MEREQQQILIAYKQLAKRWDILGLDAPPFSALELSREAEMSVGKVLNTISSEEAKTDDYSLKIESNDNVRPYKRAVKAARYQSKRPGKFSADKVGLKQNTLEERLFERKRSTKKIVSILYSPETERNKKRNIIKQRLESRWIAKSANLIVNPTTEITLTSEESIRLATYKSLIDKYNLFDGSDGMTRTYPLSPEVFKLTPLLMDQVRDLQEGFYGTDGVFANLSVPPALVRLDLGITPDGSLKIFELEGDKTNGFGYSSVADKVRGYDSQLPGISELLAQEAKATKLGIPLGQRFYRPEMIALARILREDYRVDARAIKKDEYQRFDQLLNWPKSWGPSPDNVNLLIPTNPVLNSKSFLPNLTSYSKIKPYLPNTVIVTKDSVDYWRDEITNRPNNYIVKKSESSGAAGVAFNTEKAMQFLENYEQSPCIVQENVEQQPFVFTYIDDYGKIKRESMYTRIEAYLGRRGLASVLVTARPYLPVHGATDAIQIAATTNL